MYGLFFHRVTVEEKKQREVSVAVSTLPGLGESPPESSGEPKPAPPERSPESADGSASDDVDPFRSPSASETPAANSGKPLRESARRANCLPA